MTKNRQAVVDAVVALHLDSGTEHTVGEIAAKAGLSERSVKAVLKEVPYELVRSEAVVKVPTKNYPTLASYHKVPVYSPTRDTLRVIIVILKIQVDRLHTRTELT